MMAKIFGNPEKKFLYLKGPEREIFVYHMSIYRKFTYNASRQSKSQGR